jgi:nitroimidazol reductase NimA-like FMN-containing flavoprotein (pyridoxamine 5'-phosphate oxidase superfamily)
MLTKKIEISVENAHQIEINCPVGKLSISRGNAPYFVEAAYGTHGVADMIYIVDKGESLAIVSTLSLNLKVNLSFHLPENYPVVWESLSFWGDVEIGSMTVGNKAVNYDFIDGDPIHSEPDRSNSVRIGDDVSIGNLTIEF